MSNTPKRRAPKRAAAEPAVAADVAAPVAEEREPRGARRKRETRGRLLEAALKLMAEKGMEGVQLLGVDPGSSSIRSSTASPRPTA